MACMVSSSDDGGREGVCTVKRLRRSKYKIERKEAEKENMFGDGD